ncbi:hypothetical protein OJF2_76060 [Aquisphaera giovannonii]|uniref:DUF2267 domain-containing protein n=1 Tax=Aquisphaera giovannonii TaxID=406548 RepID=A0A5B9WFH5_9BACT|nr:DUF2267 domain-containing protein [Aquisphaera giovannonii]QEH38994.1 hypothetical protein OJF2_76060 [Aquisphaera giovannonii]
MNAAIHAPFEGTIRTTSTWLSELTEGLEWDDPHRAYRALRSVLHALRDRLTVAEAVDLGAQLPMLIRGLYYEGWTPNHKPVRERRREDFLAHIAAAFRDDPEVSPEGVAWAVFEVLQRHVSAGEIGDVKAILPAEIRTLWPRTEAHRGS